MKRQLTAILAADAAVTLVACGASLAQAPVPSSGPLPASQSAPVPSAGPAASGSGPGAPVPGVVAPVPGANAAAPGHSAYQQLPLSAADAQTRIDELKSLLPASRPQDLQETIYQLCEWLADIADGHNRLASAFGKHEATRAQADAERRAAQRFHQLKNQAQLLKAELLIKQQRYPEALGPLVEIVVAEPRSATGQAAYRHLKDMGFAEEVIETKTEPAQAVQPLPPALSDGAGTVSPGAAAVPGGHVTGAGPAAPTHAVVVSPPDRPKAPPQPNKGRSQAAASGRPPTIWLTGSPTGGAEKPKSVSAKRADPSGR